MIYFKVKPAYDQFFLAYIKYGKTYFARTLIVDELYTKKELEKLNVKNIENLPYFEQIKKSPSKVFWFFGARFEMEE